MKKQILVMMIAALMFMPTSGIAMSHGENGKKMDHGDMKKMDHGDMKKMDHGDMKKMDHGDMGHMGMDSSGDMIMLGMESVAGVKGMFHLNDVREKMAEHGMKQTHHIMVAFVDEGTGDPIEEGVVAVKIEGPDGQISDPIKMMGMEGHFGADITLDEQGVYLFKIGTKLADGEKRTFETKFENK